MEISVLVGCTTPLRCDILETKKGYHAHRVKFKNKILNFTPYSSYLSAMSLNMKKLEEVGEEPSSSLQ